VTLFSLLILSILTEKSEHQKYEYFPFFSHVIEFFLLLNSGVQDIELSFLLKQAFVKNVFPYVQVHFWSFLCKWTHFHMKGFARGLDIHL